MGEQSREPLTTSIPDPTRLREDYKRIVRAVGVERVREILETIEEHLDNERDASGRSLTDKEMDLATHKGREDRAGGPGPDLLLLIVGYSPEPLLLAAVYHEPREVVLLKSLDLDRDYLVKLAERWDRFVGPRLPDLPPGEQLLRDGRGVRDSPEDLFRTVAKVVGQARRGGAARIVLDITGAKKTMVAGAFLAAGHLGIETSYVDFDHYDSVLRRPLPGSPRPGLLPHPAELFRLGERRELASLFEAGRYEEVRRRAERLAEAAGSATVTQVLGEEEAERQAHGFTRLARIAGAYQLWADGFYRDAAEGIRDIPGLPMPPQVEALAEVWPSWRADDSEEQRRPGSIVKALGPDRVLESPVVPMAYFVDLLVRWGREQIARSPRDGFLRLYGAIESLFFWAFHALAEGRREALELVPEDPRAWRELLDRFAEDEDGRPIDWPGFLLADLVDQCRDSSTMALAVLAARMRPVRIRLDRLKDRLGSRFVDVRRLASSVALTCNPPPLAPEQWDALMDKKSGLNHFRTLRNKAVHWCVPVSVPTAQEFLGLFAKAANFLLPLVSEGVERNLADRPEELRRFQGWAGYLDRAIRGEVAQELRPRPFAEVAALAGLELETSEDGKGLA
ncbi:MAG TPA: hypothetical protein VF017_20675 [Thermoanaerobaculia bacterium]|nr:hypothetical protein [Thermoanaerobaculia bacterium]